MGVDPLSQRRLLSNQKGKGNTRQVAINYNGHVKLAQSPPIYSRQAPPLRVTASSRDIDSTVLYLHRLCHRAPVGP